MIPSDCLLAFRSILLTNRVVPPCKNFFISRANYFFFRLFQLYVGFEVPWVGKAWEKIYKSHDPGPNTWKKSDSGPIQGGLEITQIFVFFRAKKSVKKNKCAESAKKVHFARFAFFEKKQPRRIFNRLQRGGNLSKLCHFPIALSPPKIDGFRSPEGGT